MRIPSMLYFSIGIGALVLSAGCRCPCQVYPPPPPPAQCCCHQDGCACPHHMREHGGPSGMDEHGGDRGDWEGGGPSPGSHFPGGFAGIRPWGPGPHFAGPPAELFDACNGKKAGDECSAKKDDWEVKATCNTSPHPGSDGRLACVPGRPKGPAPAASEPSKPAAPPAKPKK